MRQKHDVLMQGKDPEGGVWNYDAENRKAFGKAGPQNIPAPPPVNIDAVTQEVIDLVEQQFAHHLAACRTLFGQSPANNPYNF